MRAAISCHKLSIHRPWHNSTSSEKLYNWLQKLNAFGEEQKFKYHQQCRKDSSKTSRNCVTWSPKKLTLTPQPSDLRNASQTHRLESFGEQQGNLRMLKNEDSTWQHERNCSSNEWLPSCYCCCWSTWGWVKRWARAQHRRPLQRSAAATGRTESSQTRSWWLHFSSHPWKMPPEILQILLQLQIEYETFWKQLSARDPLHHIRKTYLSQKVDEFVQVVPGNFKTSYICYGATLFGAWRWLKRSNPV